MNYDREKIPPIDLMEPLQLYNPLPLKLFSAAAVHDLIDSMPSKKNGNYVLEL